MFRDCHANQETLISNFFILGAIARDIISESSTSFSHDRLNNKISPPVYALGGCAVNIAVPLEDAGFDANVTAPIGTDRVAEELSAEIEDLGLGKQHLLQLTGAQSTALIITDPTGSQHTYFAPGIDPSVSQWQEHLSAIPLCSDDCVVQAPHKPELMLTALSWAQTAGLTVWAPGQYIDELSQSEITRAFKCTDMLVANRYEASRLDEFNGPTIITNGAEPVIVRWGTESVQFTPSSQEAIDPTGCGDAFLAGLLIGLRGKQPTDMTALCNAIPQAISYAHRCLAHQGTLTYLR